MNAIIKYLSKDNRNIAVDIEDIILFDDLIQLKQEEMKKLHSHFSSKLIGLALRVADKNLKEHFSKYASPKDQEVIEEILNGPPQKKVEAEAAVTQIMLYVRSLQEQGLFKFTINEKQVFV